MIYLQRLGSIAQRIYEFINQIYPAPNENDIHYILAARIWKMVTAYIINVYFCFIIWLVFVRTVDLTNLTNNGVSRFRTHDMHTSL